MRVRILLVLSAALVLSIGVTTAAASTASKQLCVSYGGVYAIKAKSSFFRPFTKKQHVLWTCNGYSGGSAASQALSQACSNDGGVGASTLDSGVATCWKNAPV